MNNTTATLEKLDRMGLRGMARSLRTAMEAGGGSNISPEELLSTIVDAEWEDRRGRKLARLLKGARFRYRAGVEDVDFGIKRNLSKSAFLRLADCRWIAEHQSLIVTGPCGSGKSFIASALGQQACIFGYRVLYWSASKLFAQLKLAKADGSYLRELGKIARRELLAIDDFGLEALDTASRLALLEILEDRHGRASTLIASQLPVAKWHESIGEANTSECHTVGRADTRHDYRPFARSLWRDLPRGRWERSSLRTRHRCHRIARWTASCRSPFLDRCRRNNRGGYACPA